MKNRIEIYFPIVSDFRFEIYPFAEKHYIINEINEVLKLNLFEHESYIVNYSARVDIEEYNPKISTQNLANQFLLVLKEDSLKFTIESEVDLNFFKVTHHVGDKVTRITDEHELLQMLPHSLKDAFADSIFEILILSQIARPGSLKLRDGIIYVNNIRHYEIIPNILNIREHLELRDTRNYPNIQFLNFTSYYSWILNNDLLFPLKSINSYQKALVNLSYVFAEENDISRFIFQMRILEEIYTDSIYQIAEQLDRRIQLFLGEIEKFKKQIKQLYDVRSKFLHGASQLPPFHKKEYEFESYDNSETGKLHEASTICLLLIISTLQKMYLENRLELYFIQTIK